MKFAKLSKLTIALLSSFIIYAYFKGKFLKSISSKNVHQNSSSPKKFLTQESANFRSSVIKTPVFYEVIYNLQKGEEFKSTVIIKFELINVVQGLFLDFQQGEIKRFQINNQIIESKNYYDGVKLLLPESNLIQGQNEVVIMFSKNYNQDGNGLHSFIDTDQKQYVYSNSEPWSANKFIPCFDQPDLRSIFKASAIAPSDWTLISNEDIEVKDTITNFMETKIESQIKYVELIKELKPTYDETENMWIFKKTPILSTYIFFIGAGPYKKIVCPQDKLHDNIPMALYSRESLYEYLLKDAEEIFTIVTESMKFYESFFGQKFKYSKYDHVFSPEFNAGAMENPGAVTVNDNSIFKELTVPEKKFRRASTISHELCHMWFGNFVTMKWWNDLWLNESFAVFFSYLALSKINVPQVATKNSWLSFYLRKGQGYSADQLKTTHPISGDVQNTEIAETIFDGITYSKGAATLKQIYYLVGGDNFSEALKSYFNTYGWQAATLKDFLGAIQMVVESKYDIKQNPHLDLDLWSKEWIQKAGLNEVTLKWNPQDSSPQSKLQLIQSAVLPEYPTLRFNKLRVAFVDGNGNIYHTEDIVLQNQKVTELVYDGQKQPAAIIPNFSDQGYIKIVLDKQSYSFLNNNLNKIQDDLTRMMIWRSLQDQAQEATISPIDFVLTVLKNIEAEENLSIQETVLGYVEVILNDYIPFDIQEKLQLKEKLFDLVKSQLLITKSDSKFKQALLRDKLILFASTEKDTKFLLEWFNGKIEELKQVELTINAKWQIIKVLVRSKNISSDVKKLLISGQLKADSSNQGQLYAKQFSAIFASLYQREQIWQSFFNKSSTDSVRTFEHVMQGFNDISNIQENQKYFNQFFKNVISIFQERSKQFAKAFWTYLFPLTDNLEQLLGEVQLLIKTCPEDQQWLSKLLTEKEDLLKKRIKSFEFIRKKQHFRKVTST